MPPWRCSSRSGPTAAPTARRVRYAGEIRATGEVLADMLPLLRRCGFDAVQLRADQPQRHAERALGYFSTHYQKSLPERSLPGAAR